MIFQLLQLPPSPSITLNARQSLDHGTVDLVFDQDLPPDWEVESEEGGQGYHFYNKITGEMRPSHPTEASHNGYPMENGSISSAAETVDRDPQSSTSDSPLTAHSFLDKSMSASHRSEESSWDKVRLAATSY
jgi:hypothetical protein